MKLALLLTALLSAQPQGSGTTGGTSATPGGGQTGTGQTGPVGPNDQQREGGILPSREQEEQHNERARRRRSLREQGSQRGAPHDRRATDPEPRPAETRPATEVERRVAP